MLRLLFCRVKQYMLTLQKTDTAFGFAGHYWCLERIRPLSWKVQVFFIVWYQVWRPIIRLYILPPGHLTCSFVCHFNSTESIQSCSRFGALNLSYTLPYLSYQVLIFTWVKWSIWGWSALPKDTTSQQCPKIERGETWYFSVNSAPSGKFCTKRDSKPHGRQRHRQSATL